MKFDDGNGRVGMTRRNDYDTSARAADTVSKRQPTLRQRVIDFALEHTRGFIDEELAVLDPTGPESSIRKRRTELAQEAIILAVPNETRRNSKGQDSQLWMHRAYFTNPPPVRQRPKGKLIALQEENARLRAEIDLLKEHLAARHG